MIKVNFCEFSFSVSDGFNFLFHFHLLTSLVILQHAHWPLEQVEAWKQMNMSTFFVLSVNPSWTFISLLGKGSTVTG